ncbi:MAG: branched-chain amino acid ABC transporter permease [Dehalococcoidales bacterium]|nr:branched-chain amino acid ABC transporter permease [Dehalococcoidales bacterium]
MEFIISNLLNGLSFGMVLFLIAAGLSIIIGIMGIINLAHGALYMLGAYVGWTIAVHNGLNFWLAVVVGGLAAGLAGLFIERGFLRHLYKQMNEQVLLTFGFVYIITNVCLWIWGGQAKVPFTDPALSGSLNLAGLMYPKTRIVVISIGLALAVGLWWLQDKTRIGAMVRAGMDNKEMIMGLGINLGRISMFVFIFAAFIAGAAGVIGAQLWGVYSYMGLQTLLFALIIIIVGGVGSIQGALTGALLIGVIDAFGKALFPELAMFTMYIVMVVILIVRPSGLLGRKV